MAQSPSLYENYEILDNSNFESNNNNNSPAKRVRKNQLRRNIVSNATRRAINERSRIRNQAARNRAAALAAEVARNQNRFLAANLPAPKDENNKTVNQFYKQFESSSRSRKKRKSRKSRR